MFSTSQQHLRRLLYFTIASLHPSPPPPGILQFRFSTFIQHTAHLNLDHGEEPTIRPPAASTLTPSPFSNRTFSPLCLPVTPHLPHSRISMVTIFPFEARHSAHEALLAWHRQMLRLPQKKAKGSISRGMGLLWRRALTRLRNPQYPHQQQRRDDKVPSARMDCSSARFPRLEGRRTDGSRGQGRSYMSPRALGKERATQDLRVSMGFGPPNQGNSTAPIIYSLTRTRLR